MKEAGQIERQSFSYRQGLVLGLTMAEIMLLLVFCLLLAAGATLRRERMARESAERDVAILRDARPDLDAMQKELSSLRLTLNLEIEGRRKAERQAAVLSDDLKAEAERRRRAEVELAILREMEPIAEAFRAVIMNDARVADALNQAGPNGAMITDLWDEIVESRDAVRAVIERGISVAELRDNAEFFAQANELRRNGADGESLRRQSEVAETMRELEVSGVTLAVIRENGNLLADPNTLRRQAELADSVRRTLSANGIDPSTSDLSRTLDALDRGIKALKADEGNGKGDDPNGHKWPPMISLSEAGGYFFKLGSAELDTNFEKRLHEVVVPTLLKTAQDFDVDVIEVVGHTDELPIGAKNSNLDRDMVEVLKGNKPIASLRPGDNAGLGITRSVSVVRSLLQDGRLTGLRILPLSGAQLVKTDETLANGTDVQGDVKERRRIEIRLRKSVPPEQPKAGGDVANANKG
ncbi:hypothetical protein [Microvirga sp. VF16]|uniref:hypothetical protein n=1 Tax=Microvirga sp. VF16 TaxID=2807101 RepID=UPI00193E04DB|nr:hypothetical protein [Microvirga sp. VF16]QRM35450.1 hypothetical protein JO965_44735 [Microvirga sp. VF16]